jgi:hypothetical protein
MPGPSRPTEAGLAVSGQDQKETYPFPGQFTQPIEQENQAFGLDVRAEHGRRDHHRLVGHAPGMAQGPTGLTVKREKARVNARHHVGQPVLGQQPAQIDQILTAVGKNQPGRQQGPAVALVAEPGFE